MKELQLKKNDLIKTIQNSFVEDVRLNPNPLLEQLVKLTYPLEELFKLLNIEFKKYKKQKSRPLKVIEVPVGMPANIGMDVESTDESVSESDKNDDINSYENTANKESEKSKNIQDHLQIVKNIIDDTRLMLPRAQAEKRKEEVEEVLFKTLHLFHTILFSESNALQNVLKMIKENVLEKINFEIMEDPYLGEYLQECLNDIRLKSDEIIEDKFKIIPKLEENLINLQAIALKLKNRCFEEVRQHSEAVEEEEEETTEEEKVGIDVFDSTISNCDHVLQKISQQTEFECEECKLPSLFHTVLDSTKKLKNVFKILENDVDEVVSDKMYDNEYYNWAVEVDKINLFTENDFEKFWNVEATLKDLGNLALYTMNFCGNLRKIDVLGEPVDTNKNNNDNAETIPNKDEIIETLNSAMNECHKIGLLSPKKHDYGSENIDMMNQILKGNIFNIKN
jgi:hypothetical protein